MRIDSPAESKKIICNRAYELILQYIKNKDYDISISLMIFSDILSSFRENAHDLLSCKKFWNIDYVVDQNNKDKYSLSEFYNLPKFEKIDLGKVFPDLAYHTYIANLPYHKLEDLDLIGYFDDLDDVYVLRIKKYLLSNKSSHMQHELFSNTIIDKEYVEKMIREHKMMKPSKK